MGSGANFVTRNLIVFNVRVIKSRRLKWTGNANKTKNGGVTYKIITDNLVEKKTLGKSRHRCEENTSLDLEETCKNEKFDRANSR